MKLRPLFGALMGATVLGFAALTIGTGSAGELANVITGAFSSDAGLLSNCVAVLNARSTRTYHDSDFAIHRLTFDPAATTGLVLKSKLPSECGTAGCVFRLCEEKQGVVTILPFQYAGKQLTALASRTDGMYDLNLHSRNDVTFVWDGIHYTPRI